MKKVGQIASKVLAMKNSQTSLVPSLTKNNEISVYEGTLSKKVVVEQNLRIRNSFPALTEGFFKELGPMLKEDKFSDQRFIDSVSHVIRTCIYPQPTVAQFLSWDKRIKLYTHAEIVDMTTNNSMAFTHFPAVRIEGVSKPMYASRLDIELYKLTPWKET